MIEESVLKNSIKQSDLVGSSLFISNAGTQLKLLIKNKQAKVCHAQEWTLQERDSIWDLLSLKASDLQLCHQIHVLTHFENYTLVPEALYSQSNQKDYLNQLTVIDNTLPVVADYIKSAKAYLVYQVSQNVLDFLKECPQHAILHHHAAIFIEYHQEKLISQPSEVYIHFEENLFNCIVFVNNQLVYSNNQSFLSSSDAIYFILAIFQRLGLDPNEQTIIISGRIMPYSDLYNTIMRFILNVQWFESNEDINISLQEDSSIQHLFSDLIRLSACV